MNEFRHNNSYYSKFENHCWAFFSHILERIIRGDDIVALKAEYEPKRVDFFNDWHNNSKRVLPPKVITPKKKLSRKERKKRRGKQ